MAQAAFLGGLFIGILSALPIVNVANCCCLWIIGGGMIAAYLVQQDQPARITLGRGARAGALAGLAGALIWLFAAIALNVVVAPLQERMVEAMLRNAQDMPPDARAWLEQIGDRASSPLRYALGFVLFCVLGPIVSALGGMLGVTLFGRDSPTSPGDIVPPPLPPQ
jgi:hypothetical protein